MNYPLLISFHSMAPSAALEKTVREKAAKLGVFCKRITSCRVTIQGPHHHRHKGNAIPVRIELTVPGHAIVINRPLKRFSTAISGEHGREAGRPAENHRLTRYETHEDVYATIRDAFDAAVRRMQHYIGRRHAMTRSPH